MKILYYTHTYFLDCDFPLVKALEDLGHEVYLIFEIAPHCLKTPIFEIKKIKPTTEILNISDYSEFDKFSKYINKTRTFVLNRIGKGYGVDNLRLRKAFRNLIDEINPEIIHCTDFIDVYDLFLYRYKSKIIQIVHDPFPHTGEHNLRKWLGRLIGIRLLQKFVLLNRNQLDKFISTYKLKKEQVFLNTLGTYDCIKDFANNGYFTDIPNNIVLFWGRISPYKGIEFLLQAARIIHREIPDLEFVIAGSGTYYFDISQYKKDEHIRIINRFISLNELNALLQKAIVTVCPYTDATQSGVVMTSFTMQVPVIVTNVGGLPEMVDDGKSGFVVEPRNIEQLISAIIKVYDDECFRLEMKNYIFKSYYEGSRCWKNIAETYIYIYNI